MRSGCTKYYAQLDVYARLGVRLIVATKFRFKNIYYLRLHEYFICIAFELDKFYHVTMSGVQNYKNRFF